MFGIFRKEDPIEKFWKWFQSNEKQLRNFQDNPDKTLTQVLDKVTKIQRGLSIEFEPPKANAITVTVSANGDRNLFPIVKEIVAKAPLIDDWTFVSFRQRMRLDQVKGMVIKAQDKEITPGNMKFIDNILGEYDCVTKVRHYDFQKMPLRQEELKELKQLTDLAQYVDDFHKSKSN
jgi:hypothetical protein